jgi:hypothetical protein
MHPPYSGIAKYVEFLYMHTRMTLYIYVRIFVLMLIKYYYKPAMSIRFAWESELMKILLFLNNLEDM